MMKAMAVAVSAAVALLPTAFVLWMLAENNNNGEVYDTLTGRIDVSHILAVASIIFVPSILLCLLVSRLVRAASRERP
jgi:hypothetical protein